MPINALDPNIYVAKSIDGVTCSTAQQASGARTDVSPSLAAPDNLYMAWKNTGDQTMWWSSSSDSTTWQVPQQISQAFTNASPALAFIGYRLYLAFKGAGNDQSMWWSRLGGTNTWDSSIQLKVGNTSTGPALIGVGSTFYLAWKGSDNDLRLWFSSSEDIGASWAVQQQVLGAATDNSPALAALASNSTTPIIYLAWKDAASTAIFCASMSVTIDNTTGASTSALWSTPVPVSGTATDSGPALTTFNNTLYLAWKERASQNLWYSSSPNGTTWSTPQPISGANTGVGPTLSVFKNTLSLAWDPTSSR